MDLSFGFHRVGHRTDLRRAVGLFRFTRMGASVAFVVRHHDFGHLIHGLIAQRKRKTRLKINSRAPLQKFCSVLFIQLTVACACEITC